MIDSKGLMIGNIVTINNSKSWPKLKDINLSVISISEITDHLKLIGFPLSKYAVGLKDIDGNEYHQFEQFIEPIPLTEEILLKCGFGVVTESSAGKRYAYLNNGVFSSNLAFTYWVIGKTKNKFFRGDLECKYVHELQNLYTALSGKELQINL